VIQISENAAKVLEKRYMQRNGAGELESPEALFHRVAENISAAELAYGATEEQRGVWERRFFRMMASLEFLPNSPTLMNAGTGIQQLAACFVLPVGDSMDAIFDSVKHAALIHKSGGGTGFSFSRLRPENDVVSTTHAVSSGPLSFMNVFDAATEAVKQGGRRRGANMAILRVDHPDILDFISAKDDRTRLTNFNLSVALTEEFMRAAVAGEDYPLVNPRTGEECNRLAAAEVFERLVDSAWESGEPGIVFIDRINADNPTPLVGDIESTNPCGEQPLLPYESCNLGSVNLAAVTLGEAGEAGVDYDRLGENVRTAVRFLDNVIDMSRYPLPEIEEQTRSNRKIGLGVMGFADMLMQMGIPYDSEAAESVAEEVMSFIEAEAVGTSIELADERGPFPNFEGSIYDTEGARPRRNATVTTIAPTGTISIIAGCSSGIEPTFALAFDRHVMDGQNLLEINPLFETVARREGFYSEELMERLAEDGSVAAIEEVPERWRQVFETAHDISPVAHLRMQAAFQKHTENAVSKTVNFPRSATREDVAQVFKLAFELGCKGVTVYRDGSREGQVLRMRSETPSAESRAPRRRQDLLCGTTRKVSTGCGNLYVTINETDGGPFELFAQMGKCGGCAGSQTEAIGRLVSLALRAGVDAASITRQLRGVRCPSPAWENGKLVLSCADAISKALESYLHEKQPDQVATIAIDTESLMNRCAGLCPDCGGALEFDGGCAVCRACGYSRCG
jgi:ribonucleoside-diphosphate reductase alpha chain